MRSRYKIVVEFFSESDSVDDAERELKILIDSGIIHAQRKLDGKIYDYDIVEAEPAECE